MGTDTRDAAVELELPPLYCPIEPAIHPRFDLIRARTVEWLDTHRFSSRKVDRAWLLATNLDEAFARGYPNGSEEPMVLGARWMNWSLIALDDDHLESSAQVPISEDAVGLVCRLVRHMEVPDLAVPAGDSLANVIEPLRSIMGGLRSCATQTQIQRFIDAHRYWLLGCLWQISNVNRRVIPDMDDYTTQRLGSVGTKVCASWSEITAGSEIPARELHSPAVRALSEASFVITGWDNDLMSYRKEVLRDRNPTQNFVTVIAHQYHCSVHRAVDEAVAIRNRTMALFLRLGELVRPRVSAPTRRYIDDLGNVIRATLDWQSTSARYTCFTPRSELPTPSDPISLSWTDRSPAPGSAPEAIPSIRWWWAQLDELA